LPYKKTDDGEIVGKAKLKGAYGTDKVDPPLQVDAKRNRLPADFMLTTGSRVNLSVTIVPYNTGAVNGVSLRLRAVQVIELAEGMSASDPFGEVDGYVAGARQQPATRLRRQAQHRQRRLTWATTSRFK
jgi:type IV secretory pathway VirB9-like protein